MISNAQHLLSFYCVFVRLISLSLLLFIRPSNSLFNPSVFFPTSTIMVLNCSMSSSSLIFFFLGRWRGFLSSSWNDFMNVVFLVCSYPLGQCGRRSLLFIFFNFNFSFTSTIEWSLPILVPLNALTSCTAPLHLLFISKCVLLSVEVQVYLCMFLCWYGTSYNTLLFLAKILVYQS